MKIILNIKILNDLFIYKYILNINLKLFFSEESNYVFFNFFYLNNNIILYYQKFLQFFVFKLYNNKILILLFINVGIRWQFYLRIEHKIIK